MPHDPTNMPFPQSRSYSESNPLEPKDISIEKLKGILDIEKLLLEEFNYASVCAYQSVDERSRLSNLYYVFLGVLLSGLAIINQLGGYIRTYSQLLVIGLLFLASNISFIFFVSYKNLKQSYDESISCMNVIKEFYIDEWKQQWPNIEHAFRWRQSTMPTRTRIGSTTFVMSYLIILTGSICFAGGVFIGTKQFIADWIAAIISLVVFIIALSLQIYYYRITLGMHRKAIMLQEQAKRMETLLQEEKN